MKSKKEAYSLFGHPISREVQGRTLTDQVEEIIVREMHAGRWQVNDRIPGITTLANQSGINRNVFQIALKNLCQLGYFDQRKYQGTFLINTSPQKQRLRGTIGIALPNEDSMAATLPTNIAAVEFSHSGIFFDSLYISWLKETATRRGYGIEMLHLTPEDWGLVDTPRGVFGNRVQGIIALYTLRRPLLESLPPGHIPMVFWRDHYQADCHPAVIHDHFTGFYLLTKRLIAAGHRKIAFFQTSTKTFRDTDMPLHPAPLSSNSEMALRFQAVERALEEAQIPSNRKAFQESLAIPNADMRGIRRWFEAWKDLTAVIVASGHLAEKVVTVLDVMGIRVPQDVSLVSPGPVFHQNNGNVQRITSLEFDGAAGAAACFDVLESFMANGRPNCSRFIVPPRIVDGCSLAPPRAANN